MKPIAYCKYLDHEGATLFTCIALPAATGTFPTVIMRNPYVDQTESMDNASLCEQFIKDQMEWLSRGYAVVEQHCRGCGKSTGFTRYMQTAA